MTEHDVNQTAGGDVNPAAGSDLNLAAPSDIDEVATSLRLTQSVTSIAGVTGLAPGLRHLVASAAAKVLRGVNGEPVGVDVSHGENGTRVRIDAYFDDSRPVAEIVDEIYAVVEVDIVAAGTVEVTRPLEIDLRVVSRGRAGGASEL